MGWLWCRGVVAPAGGDGGRQCETRCPPFLLLLLLLLRLLTAPPTPFSSGTTPKYPSWLALVGDLSEEK